MALSPKLKKETHSNVIESLILKGGTSGAEENQNEIGLKRVQLRISVADLELIDQLVAKRPGNLARHTWIMEAIAEKINRDGQKSEQS